MPKACWQLSHLIFKGIFRNWISGKSEEVPFSVINKHNNHFWVNEKLDDYFCLYE